MKIPAFLLKQTIKVEPFLGASGVGPVFDTPFIEKGRIEFKREKFKDANGSEIVSSAILFVRAASKIKAQDRATYDGIQYEVVMVSPKMGLSSPSHKEVRLR